MLSRPSNSRLAETYKTEEFLDEWCNDVQAHVARNLLYLRRYRRMSQASVAKAIGTSQPAIARIESGQENITLDTLRRLIVAMKGRFFISTPPRECAPHQANTWWEVNESTAGSWCVVGWAVRRSDLKDQAIVGMERAHGQDLSGSTLPLKPGMFIEAGA